MLTNSEPFKILNDFGEKLDVLIEGNRDSPEIVIFVHGYGTDKDEGFASFIDLSNGINDKYLVLRYDQSGYGNSEGEDEAYNLQKSAGDLKSVLNWVKVNYPQKKPYIVAHSLGCYVTLLLEPYEVEKIIFTGIPNSDTKYVVDSLQARIKKGGGKVNEHGTTVYKRSRGDKQLIGPEFWKTLRNLNVTQKLINLSTHSSITIFKPMQDDVLGEDHFDEYKAVKGVEYCEIDGDHNFTNLKDRSKLISELRNRLSSRS